MSLSRDQFKQSLSGINDAVRLESLAQGATGVLLPPSIHVLRRGILVAGLIALESFVRDRTTEVLRTLERWPKSYADLPEKLRIAGRLNALSNLQQYAKMLKRQGDDYDTILTEEIAKMASGNGSVIQFTKFVSGDFTGNLSDTSLKEIVGSLQVSDCWNTYRTFAADVGIGVPSVHEIVKSTVRKRHRSAHSSSYTPTATEITELSSDLLCIAICFDVSVTSSLTQSLNLPEQWAAGSTKWRDDVILYIAQPKAGKLRVIKLGNSRALASVDDFAAARGRIPLPPAGKTTVTVLHDDAGRPVDWEIR